ncbi:uncharacterized protein RCC_10035 [Ramularia collo-cygni]|uniref:Xylanolytic transcriptional activator regulatory domain-containing protein n=1 Tax=Ramularia collo-cygni TaxID=112498 RepID=A0A2D3VGF9_9PEZI|nr:uncharacterized protein RCC_10035 [Ramularia collo-cygni]CZT24312.1 uncharacterized protein RCC_10035 [Ramularia collo-cygni]
MPPCHRLSPAHEIIRHIRQNADPFAVLRLVQEGDLLLQRNLNNTGSEARALDADAFQQSKYKLRARPWTNVAGDGIVSNLITIVLASFSAPCVHESAFLADFAAQDTSALFCSPLLVNAMCAVGAFSSSHAEALDRLAIDDLKLRERFYQEAQRLLEIERGKPSVTTVQALFLLYLYTGSAAMDRAGRVYRLTACEMYNRMRLGTQLLVRSPVTDPKSHEAQRKILSRIAWGAFCAESVMAYNYLQVSLIKIPSVPRLFGDQTGYATEEGNRPLGLEDALAARCDVLAIFYRIASYEPREPNDVGSEGDIRTRQRLYDALSGWERILPPKSRYASEFAHHFHVLNAYYHFVAVVLWRPLQDIDTTLRDNESNAARLCISHCDALLKEIDESKIDLQGDLLRRGTTAALYFWYMAAFTLVTMIKRHLDSREPLVRVCRSLHSVAKCWPSACVILQGVHGMSQQLRVVLPQEAAELCLEAGKMLDLSASLDIPVSWAIPRHADLMELLSDHGADTEEPAGVELSKLISKWNTLSIEA